MKRGSIFELSGVPKFQEAIPLALQHVVAMIVGCVTPAIIVAGAVGGGGLSDKDRVILIQASLVISALSTLIQLFPIGKKGIHTWIRTSDDHGCQLCLRSKYAGDRRRLWNLDNPWCTDCWWYCSLYHGYTGP